MHLPGQQGKTCGMNGCQGCAKVRMECFFCGKLPKRAGAMLQLFGDLIRKNAAQAKAMATNIYRYISAAWQYSPSTRIATCDEAEA
jgi:hypothetical protein